jgi:cephalosporin-C deacetylase-like acetyl esterase
VNLTTALIGVALSLAGVSDDQFKAAIQQSLGGTAPDQMVNRYLEDIAFANIAQRSERYEGLETPEDIAAYQQAQYDYFVSALGGFPERTPLNARKVGEGSGEAFRYEKIIYESRPNFFVTAVLYLPVTEGPYPGVLVPCGHSNNGKAAEAYQRACILLARHGIAAFCYDPIGQGERRHYQDENGVPNVSTTVEHTIFDVGAILTGTNIAQYRIWDGMRGIDYLQSRPDIITDKIGVTGNSGGGTLSSYIMALDKRVAVAAPSCYVTSWKRILETIGPQDGEQNIFGQLKQGLDHADYIHIRAPKPTLMLTATQDFFDIQGSWDTFREAKRLYTRLGVPERISLVETDEKHGFSERLREGMVQWMQRWLLETDAPVDETNFGILSDADLQCTPTGLVSGMEGYRSTLDLNKDRAEALKGKRAAFWKDTPAADALKKVRELAGIRPDGDLPPVTAETLEEGEHGAHIVRDFLLTIEPGIVLPARAYTPKSDVVAQAHIFTPDNKLEELQSILDAGLAPDAAYLFVSLRGMGITENYKWGGGWLNVGNDWSTFMRAYLNGLSIVGQRSEDVRQIVAWCREYTDAPLSITAYGESTVPVLHAAALQPNTFAHVTLKGGIPSWQAVVEAARPEDQIINTVHNALSYYDLDNLQGILAPEQATVENVVVTSF